MKRLICSIALFALLTVMPSFAGPVILPTVAPKVVSVATPATTAPKFNALKAYRSLRSFWVSRAIVR